MQKNSKNPLTGIKGFDFVAKPDAKVLILGSMPGIASLKQKQYYAHPRNHFWPIMESLLTVKNDNSLTKYEKRLQLIKDNYIALWDVLAECERQGSLDSNINTKSIFLNDFNSLFTYAPEIKTILFNGKTAERLFRQHMLNKNPDIFRDFSLISLPSTSPAYAKMSLSEKISHWESLKTYINISSTCG